MSNKKQKLMKTVRELRQHLGLTQTEFAKELGQGMSTIQRYEQLVPPRGHALAKMIAMAEKAGRKDIAEVLRTGYAAEVTETVAGKYLQLGARVSYTLPGVIKDLVLLRHNLRNGNESAGTKVKAAIAVIDKVDPVLVELMKILENKATIDSEEKAVSK
jgi:transcriptional regulator with XRE-family HTH domain